MREGPLVLTPRKKPLSLMREGPLPVRNARRLKSAVLVLALKQAIDLGDEVFQVKRL